jgi:hypothetical protein
MGEEYNASWSSRSAVATCKHAGSATFSTRLQLMGGGIELGEPGSYSLSNPGLMPPKNPRARATSPGAALSETRTPSISVPTRLAECHLRQAPLLPMPPPVTDGGPEPIRCSSYHQSTISLRFRGRKRGKQEQHTSEVNTTFVLGRR